MNSPLASTIIMSQVQGERERFFRMSQARRTPFGYRRFLNEQCLSSNSPRVMEQRHYDNFDGPVSNDYMKNDG